MNAPNSHSPTCPAFASPDEALRALCARLQPVEVETVALEDAVGRVLAEAVVADRDSPPCDVSAMDGYALRRADLTRPAVPVAGEIAIGAPPLVLPPGQALRIVTGAPVPEAAELVVPREEVDEQPDRIVIHAVPEARAAGLHIRRRGENLRCGQAVVASGQIVSPAMVSALASFGVARPRVYRAVRVAIITTGNEVVALDASPAPWQIRNANGPGLAALLAGRPWLEVQSPVHVADDREALRSALVGALDTSDAVLLTGGVSAGQYDFVPEVVQSVGSEIVFHKLPVRPGRPMLGAIGPRGQVLLGLPGNPMSVLVTARRFAAVALRCRAGCAPASEQTPVVTLVDADDRTLRLWWYRPVRLIEAGRAALVPTHSSGDVVALARSDGFVEIPPQARGPGPWPYMAWEL